MSTTTTDATTRLTDAQVARIAELLRPYVSVSAARPEVRR